MKIIIMESNNNNISKMPIIELNNNNNFKSNW